MTVPLRLSAMTRNVLLAGVAVWVTASATKWTVAVYMAADNGLNEQAYEDLAEMKEVGSTAEVNVVVQVDNAARDTNPGCRRYFVRKGQLALLSDIGEVDMAEQATLGDFAGFVRDRYPADRYLVMLWDHGNGWPEGYGPRDAIFKDDSRAHMMGVAGGELAEAMNLVREALGKRVAILGFDACYMGMLEVAWEVRQTCDYILASEGLVPWGGMPYDRLLERLAANPGLAPVGLLPGFCEDYIDEYPGLDLCLSGLDMRRLEQAVPVVTATLRDSIGQDRSGYEQARRMVQTFPSFLGNPPCRTDDQVDLVNFWELAPSADSLVSALKRAVVANSTQGRLDRARGIACWFPGNYLALKTLAGSYAKLQSADTMPWLQFLNSCFGSDDVKPSQPVPAPATPGRRGDVRLRWTRSLDLAPVTYTAYEAAGVIEAFADGCEDSSQWQSSGWSLDGLAHSGSRAFYSGMGLNLDNRLELRQALAVPHGGLLSCYVYYSTEERWDSLTGFSRDVCRVEWSGDGIEWQALDSLYGATRYWQELRYVFPAAAQLHLRLRYVTNEFFNGEGVWLDDVKVEVFDTVRCLAAGIPDTNLYLFNLARDTTGHSYFVTARDSFGNVSMASQFLRVAVKTWAEPYTMPAPFSGQCRLVLDFPDGETPDVRIYTLSGVLVRNLEEVDQRVIQWNGRNQSERELADGLYIVVVQGRDFRKVGKIVRAGR